MPKPRLLPLALLCLCAGACHAEGEGGIADARAAGAAAAAGAVRETFLRAEARAEEIEARLRPLPLLRPAEEAALRRYLNADHVARARRLGVRPADTAAVRALSGEGRLVQLEDSTRYWIVREAPSSTMYVTPATHALLETLGERFQARLAEQGLPPYRLEITSALRTGAQQAELRRTNPNAAGGVSSHEFGTTVDLAYSAFAPPARSAVDLPTDVPEALAPWLGRIGDLALESVSARKSRELQAMLGRVLVEAQEEGLVLALLERLQPVYHITLARPLPEG